MIWHAEIFSFVLMAIFIYTPISHANDTASRLQPVNEAHEDPSFISFTKKLKTAIQKKDSRFISKMLLDNVEYSFGADPERKNAVDGFLKHYKIKNGMESNFWKNLDDVIELGCTRSDNTFTCPYVYSKWPDKFDSFSFVATIKENAPVRKKPDPKGGILKIASFEILKLTVTQQIGGWYTIDLGDKKIGYISKLDARGPTDYRAEFQKTSIGWKLKYFINGD